MHSSDTLEHVSAIRPIAGTVLLQAWEQGRSQPQPLRALTLLLAGRPDLTMQEAATMSVPSRDLALLQLRRASFGDALSAFAACSSCGERLEFALPTAGLAATLRTAADADCSISHDDCAIRLRLANTADIAEAAALPDLDDARALLLSRCIEATTAEGDAVPAQRLAHAVRHEALTHLQAMHAAAELSIVLPCPHCGAREPLLLDIPVFLWAEVRHAAELLLDEVHELASAYGWAEEAILAMTASRRRAYLDRLLS
jgi:hypothetical protein